MLAAVGGRLIVLVEPGRVLIWRLKDHAHADDARSQYADDQCPADDLHYDDQQFTYVHHEHVTAEQQVPAVMLV